MALISVSNNALSNITALPASIPTGALTLIKSITASASASIEFINGTNGVVLDGTYSSYIFSFSDIHPSVDSTNLMFNISTDNGSNYNVTKTTTWFRSFHNQSNDADYNFGYLTSSDLAQSTDYSKIINGIDNVSYASGVGYFQIFNPSSTTYVKHFLSRSNSWFDTGYSYEVFSAGYANTTSAINAIKFQMNTGNIDDGTIKLYGVK